MPFRCDVEDATSSRRSPVDGRRRATRVEPARRRIAAESLDAYFGAARVVRDVSFGVHTGQVTAIIGPSGCGKSTLLRCLNRMHETVPAARVEGEVRFEGRDIYAPAVSAIGVRRHIGMVFQRPTPFPTMSIRDNVAAGLKILPRGERPSRARDGRHRRARAAPRRAVGRGEGSAWTRAPSRCPADSSSVSASRARSPRRPRCCCSTSRRRRSIRSARSASKSSCTSCAIEVTIIIVTHNMQQAARISDRTAFMLAGELIEYGADERDVHRADAIRARKRTSPDGSDDRGRGRRAPSTSAGAGARAAGVAPSDFSFWYGEKQALYEHHADGGAAQRHGAHRPVGLRQVDVPALDQSHERAAARRSPRGRDPSRRRRRLQPRHGSRHAAPARRDGVPALESVPEVDLRQRRVRAARQRHSQSRATSTRSSNRRCAARRCGTR